MFQFITMDLKIRMAFLSECQLPDKGTAFDVYVDGEFYDHFLSPQYGDHTVLNALAVIAISYLEKLDVTNIKEALETFGGVKRRFNETTIANQVIVDDYAHRPEEKLVLQLKQHERNIHIKKLLQYFNHTLSLEHKHF